MLINHSLRAIVRVENDRNPQPSAAVLDSQTVRSDAHGGGTGYDAGKRTKGRRRFIIVDQARRRSLRVQGLAEALGGGANLRVVGATSSIGS